jgi:hypothetical protein
MLDEKSAQLVTGSSFEARLGDTSFAVVGKPKVTFGREGDVVVRGASVSREHCVMEWAGGEVSVRDNGSRNGTQLEGVSISGSVPLTTGHRVSLGTDLTLEVKQADASCTLLEIERGMDRGRKIVLLKDAWSTPIGLVKFVATRARLEPVGAVQLLGQKVVVPITLARGDRIERDGTTLEIVR